MDNKTKGMRKKICHNCKQELRIRRFPKSKQNKDGYRGTCRACINLLWQIRYKEKYRDSKSIKQKIWRKERPDEVREKFLKNTYGWSSDTYNVYLQKQNYGCAICGTKDTKQFKYFAIDHCHKTNFNRGLLCSTCNSGLGYFSDSIEKLKSAIEYLLLNTSDKLVLELENESIGIR